jgi:hypothetical protein
VLLGIAAACGSCRCDKSAGPLCTAIGPADIDGALASASPCSGQSWRGLSTQRLQLEVGANGQIRAKRDWTANNIGAGTIQGRNRLGKPAFLDSEAMIGWIEPRSCRIVMVELDDRGQANGWLRRDARGFYLQLEVSQSGTGAVVFFADFRRAAKELNREKPNF